MIFDFYDIIVKNDKIFLFDNGICSLISIDVKTGCTKTVLKFDVDFSVNVRYIFNVDQFIVLADDSNGIVLVFSECDSSYNIIRIVDFEESRYKVHFWGNNVVFIPVLNGHKVYHIDLIKKRSWEVECSSFDLPKSNKIRMIIQNGRYLYITTDDGAYVEYNIKNDSYSKKNNKAGMSFNYAFENEGIIYCIEQDEMNIIVKSEDSWGNIKTVSFEENINISRAQIVDSRVYLIPQYGDYIYFFDLDMESKGCYKLDISEDEKMFHGMSNYNTIKEYNELLYISPYYGDKILLIDKQSKISKPLTFDIEDYAKKRCKRMNLMNEMIHEKQGISLNEYIEFLENARENSEED